MQRNLLVMCLVALLCGSGNAQESSPVSATQVVVPRLIRFSGMVKDAVASSSVGITFTLHEGQNDNTALWIETQNVQLDGTGKYTVLLGATKAEGIPAEMFTSGKAQWLGIRVENQPEQPRVLLVSVPYALRAAEADTLAGRAPSDFITSDKLSSAVQQELQQQATSSPASGTGKKAGIKASTPTETATNFIDNNGSQVVLVEQNGAGSGLTSFATTGLAVNAKSTGTAIYGLSTGTGTSAGVEGVTSSPAGRGVYGFNTATTGTNFGVVGSANSTAGIGVFGSNAATTGAAVGVWGTTSSTAGVALKGSESATTGSTTGLLASVKSATGTAAVFQSSANGKIISGQTGSSNSEVFYVDGAGNVSAIGNLVANTVNVQDESSQYQFYVGGSGVLAASSSVNGSNLFVGGGAGAANVVSGETGIENTFVGSVAGSSNNDGYYNTFVGASAGGYNVHGNDNVYVGAFSGPYATGNDNIFIGSSAGGNNGSGHNNIYIGNVGCTQTCTESNTIRIGGDTGYGAQTAIYLAGVRGQTSSGGEAVYVASDGKLGTTTSSRRFKENIADMGDTSKLFQLRPVTFFYKPQYDDGSHQLQYGLIAEEVEKVYPEMVVYGSDGQPETVKYQYLAPMLLNALQKEHAVVTSQQERMRTQQHQIDELKARMQKLESIVLARSAAHDSR